MSKDFDNYRNKMRRNTTLFACPDCNATILPKDYEKHCSVKHGFNCKTTCIWCRKQSWGKGMKLKHASHLQDCFKQFISPIEKSENSKLKLLNLKHTYPQKSLFEFSSLPVAAEHDSLYPLDVEPPPVEFRDENLNLATSYVIKYLKTKDTHDWLHVMVRAVAFGSFVRALNEDQGKTKTLLFSCWCNGGPYENIRHRQHRHFIVISPKGHFETRVWPKVKVAKEDKPNRNFNCKISRDIVSPLHLVNTIGYLSNRKSRCKFSFKEDKRTSFQMHHFYMYRGLPKGFKLPLVLLWERGLYELLHQEKFQNISVRKLVEYPILLVNGRWMQKIKDFYNIEYGLVLPVCKRFMATNQETPIQLHLMKGRKLYFYNSGENESLDDDTWIEKQAENGNCFYEAVKEELWVPRKKDQYTLSIVKPFVDRNKELEAENTGLKRKLEACENKIKAKRAKIEDLRKDNKAKQAKIDTLHEENKQLSYKIHKIYEDEIARLKRENESLLEKLTAKDLEIKNIKVEKEELLDKYNVTENEKNELKSENESLLEKLTTKDSEIKQLKMDKEDLKMFQFE